MIPLSSEDADYYARSMTALERRVVMECSRQSTPRYEGLASRLGVSVQDVRNVGSTLMAKSLAEIRPTRSGNEYSGSGIVLNQRGERVKSAIVSRYAWARKRAGLSNT